MKKLLLIIAIIGGFQYYRDHPNLCTKLNRNNVILYSTDWCGYCQKTRVFFAQNGIAYTEYNIEQSEFAKSRYDKIAKGAGVPVVDVNGTVIKGYNLQKLRSALNL